MIYTASYFETANHHGKLVPISRTVPKGFSTKDSLDFFIPSSHLLKDWKAGKLTKQQYINKYREEMRANLPKIREWINSLDPNVDLTLLCWEKTTDKNFFCHRSLIIKFVQAWKPECYGGEDVPNQLLVKV